MTFEYDPNMSYADAVRGLLSQQQEDERKARALGALTAGMGVLSSARDPAYRHNWLGGFAPSMMAGMNVYGNSLSSARAGHKDILSQIVAAKKIKEDEERKDAYKKLFSSGGEPDWKQAMILAAQQGDIQALTSFAAREQAARDAQKLQFPPRNVTRAWNPTEKSWVEIPGVQPDETKPTNSMRQRDELIKLGYDPDFATSVAFGGIKPYSNAEGSGFADIFQLGPRRSGPPYIDSGPPKTGGAESGSVRPPRASETPPATVSDAPNPGWGSPQDTKAATQKGRFDAPSAPPGAISFTPTRKSTVDLDKTIESFGERYTKTGIEQMDSHRKKLMDALSDFIDIDQKGNWNLKPGVDVPGMGMTGRPFPQAMLGDKGKEISQVMQDIVNQKLFDLSGKAVTSSEWERMVRAIGGGAFMKDTDMIRGLKNVMDTYDALRTTVLSQANPEVLQEYMKRKTNVEQSIKQPFTGMMDEMGREIDPSTMAPTGRVFKRQANGSYVRVK